MISGQVEVSGFYEVSWYKLFSTAKISDVVLKRLGAEVKAGSKWDSMYAPVFTILVSVPKEVEQEVVQALWFLDGMASIVPWKER